jgi:hypothetical protein
MTQAQVTLQDAELLTVLPRGGMILPTPGANGPFSEPEGDFVVAGSALPSGYSQRMATVSRLYAYARHTGEVEPLEDALALAREVMHALAQAHVPRTAVGAELGRCLSLRYRLQGNVEDLREAIRVFREAIAEAAEEDPDLPACLNNLGNALADWHQRTKDAGVLEETQQAFLSAAEALQQGDPRLATVLTGLSDALHSQYLASGCLDVLDRAAEVAEQAARAFHPGDPTYPVFLNGQANILIERYERTGNAGPLAEAQEALRQAIRVTDAGTPDRALALDSMGALLNLRHQATGDLRALEEAELAFGECVAATALDDPARGGRLNNLGAARWNRYLISGDPQAERESAEAFRAAAASLPETHEHHAACVGNLANVLINRYESVGDLRALDESVSLLRRVTDLLPSRDPRSAMYASRLGVALLRRHEHLGRKDDIAAAEAAVRRAIGIAPRGDVLRPLLLNDLANVLRGRYRLDSQPATLEEAGELLRTALADIPARDPRKVTCLANLGGVLGTQYRRSADQTVLIEAISVLREARHLTVRSTSRRLGVLENLGKALRDSQAFNSSVGVMEEAMSVFGEVAAAETAQPRQRARCARAKARLAASAGLWTEAADAYCLAVSLLPAIASQELAREHKEDGLAEFTGLGSDAAAAVLQCGDAGQAIALLEGGRGVLLAQALQLRTEVDGLRKAAPALADRFQQLGRRMGSLDAPTMPAQHIRDSPAYGDLQALALAAEIAQREQLKRDWNQVLADIREVPGFSDFLCAPTPAQVISIAGPGPIAIVNVSEHRSDALIVSGGGIRVVPLPMATPEAVSDQAKKFFAATATVITASRDEERQAELRLLEVLTWLWDAVGRPVTDSIPAEGNPRSHAAAQRLWWIPTGLLSLLPLHCAGGFDQDARPSVSERFVSSYLPLLRARHAIPDDRNPRPGQQTLVVAMPATQGAWKLSGAAAEGDAVTSLSPGGRLLTGPVTRDRLLAELPDYANFHFAGHARGDPDDPSASALLLDDGPVTVQDISRLNLAHANLSYLSACETAAPGEALIDETISVASAFQMAGFRHVVATLWPVPDRVARDVATAVWSALDDKVLPGNTAASLHRAVCDLRSRFPENPSRWAPYVHVGL